MPNPDRRVSGFSRRNAPTPSGPLPPAGGGGTFEGMETRVAALEADMKEVKSDLKKVLSDLSYLRGKADSSPTTIQLIMFAVAIFAAAGLTRLFGH